jgi:2-polyprenyl-6-methoxyphenol hydroxylase-like FAD-dependent oxidoreductase
VEALLAERAIELGVEIRRGQEVVGLHQDAQGVTVEVRTESGSYELVSRYLVGCDGSHSVVRKQSQIAFSGLDPSIVGRMGDVKLTADAVELLKAKRS